MNLSTLNQPRGYNADGTGYHVVIREYAHSEQQVCCVSSSCKLRIPSLNVI